MARFSPCRNESASSRRARSSGAHGAGAQRRRRISFGLPLAAASSNGVTPSASFLARIATRREPRAHEPFVPARHRLRDLPPAHELVQERLVALARLVRIRSRSQHRLGEALVLLPSGRDERRVRVRPAREQELEQLEVLRAVRESARVHVGIRPVLEQPCETSRRLRFAFPGGVACGFSWIHACSGRSLRQLAFTSPPRPTSSFTSPRSASPAAASLCAGLTSTVAFFAAGAPPSPARELLSLAFRLRHPPSEPPPARAGG